MSRAGLTAQYPPLLIKRVAPRELLTIIRNLGPANPGISRVVPTRSSWSDGAEIFSVTANPVEEPPGW